MMRFFEPLKRPDSGRLAIEKTFGRGSNAYLLRQGRADLVHSWAAAEMTVESTFGITSHQNRGGGASTGTAPPSQPTGGTVLAASTVMAPPSQPGGITTRG
jgi:hypothetical protein